MSSDYSSYQQRHIRNLGRLAGKNIGSGSSRYSYILDSNDLTNAYLQMRNDLGYPLMVDSKYRRAIVYNKQGLEKKIQNMINECIAEASKTLANIVVADINHQLNNITIAPNGKLTIGGGSNFNIGSMLGSALGKGLVNGFFTILDEITDNDDYRRRR